LIILDILMPQMNGYQACRLLKNNPRTETIPIILLTAQVQERNKLYGFATGADSYITKPFNPYTLLDEVARLVKDTPPRPDPALLPPSKILSHMDVFHSINNLLDNKLRELTIIQDISRAMTSTLNLREILNIIVKGINEGLGFDRAMLCLISEDGDMLEGKVAIGYADDRYVKKIRIPLIKGAGILADTVLERKPFTLRDITSGYRTNFFLTNVSVEEIGPFATIPLEAKGKILGAIAVDNGPSGQSIGEREALSLSTFANQAALAIENAQLYYRLESALLTLHQTQDRLLKAERMAALGEIAAGVAHDIRNPLVSIGGFARRIQNKLADDDPNKKYADIMIREVARLEKIMVEMSDCAHQTPPELAEGDINEALKNSIALAMDLVGDTEVNLIKELDPSIPPIVIDQRRLEQAFMNIIQNAIEATIDGKDVLVKIQKDGDYVTIVVSDEGSGIPEEDMNNIFKPFFTTKTSGTGLGLAITRRIIEEDHQGNIKVMNNEKGGATFIVRIPLVRRE